MQGVIFPVGMVCIIRLLQHNIAAFSEFFFAVGCRVRLGRRYTPKTNCAEETVVMHVVYSLLIA